MPAAYRGSIASQPAPLGALPDRSEPCPDLGCDGVQDIKVQVTIPVLAPFRMLYGSEPHGESTFDLIQYEKLALALEVAIAGRLEKIARNQGDTENCAPGTGKYCRFAGIRKVKAEDGALEHIVGAATPPNGLLPAGFAEGDPRIDHWETRTMLVTIACECVRESDVPLPGPQLPP